MFTCAKEVEFDAGHRVPYHDSKCRNLHGHRYRVRLTIAAGNLAAADPNNAASGMVLDFGDIKRALVAVVHDPHDHKLLLWEKDELLEKVGRWDAFPGLVILPVIPTAEELARYFYHLLEAHLKESSPLFADGRAWIQGLEVWETPTSLATYNPPAAWNFADGASFVGTVEAQ